MSPNHALQRPYEGCQCAAGFGRYFLRLVSLRYVPRRARERPEPGAIAARLKS
jgi:hypothetical protein